VTTPEIPPVVDSFLLEDETGSFFDDIDNLQSLAPGIWDDIAASGVTFKMGGSGFRDFAQSPYGVPDTDWVYDRYQDLTDEKTKFVNGVNSPTASGGLDSPEAYLEALQYIAETSHPAIDSNGDGDTTDSFDTPQGLQPSWHPNATRIVLLATD